MDVLQQLRMANNKRQSLYDKKEWDLPRWGNAAAGEMGELCNVIKKIDRGDFTLSEANEKELIANEAADVVIYLDRLCKQAGINLQNAIVNKFNEDCDKKKCPEYKIYYY